MLVENTCANCYHGKTAHSFFKDDSGQHNLSCCLEFGCRCSCYEALDDAIPQYIRDIDRYIAQFEFMKDKMQWVLLNIKYFRNFSDKYVGYMWNYIVHRYNPWTTLLTKELYEKLDSHDAVTRARREWYEWDRKHGDQNNPIYLPFNMTTREQKVYKQIGIEQYQAMEPV